MAHQFSIVSNSDPSRVINGGTADFVVEWLKAQSDTSEFLIFSSTGHQSYISVSDFLKKHILQSHIYDAVSKFYVMDPETEDMLHNGRQLTKGMKVLIGDPSPRENLELLDEKPEWKMNRLRQSNRWCTIESDPYLDSQNDVISFVGRYDDGTKAQRSYGVTYSWLVKKDSIPDPVLEEEKQAARYNAIFEIVKEAHATNEALVTRPDYPAEEVARLVSETTRRILGALG